MIGIIRRMLQDYVGGDDVMKKVRWCYQIILMTLFVVMGTLSVCGAAHVTGKSKLLKDYISFDTAQTTKIMGDNRISIDFTGVVGDNYRCKTGSDHNPSTYYFYTSFPENLDYLVGVKGVNVKLVNNTDGILIIKWSQSTITLGEYNGVPSFPSTTQHNVGAAANVSDTILAPHQEVVMSALVGTLAEEKGTLRSGFHRLTVGEDLHAILALKTVTEDGEEKYTIAESPRIGIYEDVIKDLKIKIDYKH